MNAASGSSNNSSVSYRNEFNCGTNETSCEEEVQEVEAPDALLLGSWFLVIGVVLVGFVSNLIVIHAVCCVKRFRRPQNLMLANMSVTSVMTVVVYMSINLLEKFSLIPFNRFICGTIATILQLSFPAEGLTIMFISMDRTTAVRRPLERQKWGAVYRKIALIWVISLYVTIPAGYMIITYDPERVGSHFKCNFTYTFFGSAAAYVFVQVVFTVTSVLIPSAVMIKDLFRLTEQLKFLISCQANQAPTGFIASRQRLLRNCVIFATAFIILRIPVGLFTFLYRLPPETFIPLSVHSVVGEWRKLWILVHILHVSLNPLLVFLLSTQIRRHLRSLATPCC